MVKIVDRGMTSWRFRSGYSSESSSSTYSSMNDLSYFVVSWGCAADNNRSMTCSPVKADRIICMDRSCDRHEASGKGTGLHSVCWRATSLEWLVVHSFKDVNTRRKEHSQAFEGWTDFELRAMCDGTDDVKYVSKHLFGSGEAATRLQMHVKSYKGAAEVLDKTDSWKSCDVSLHELVSSWSGGIAPEVYVLMMKSRIESMSATLLRQKHTIEIWKEKAEKQKSKAEDLARRLKFAKKGI
jgi:hypothetical protein